ncbi:MAG TPA: NOG1 family protein [Methanotrichaceae archaeon]|nr:NOG1 family protein [Methanotrichaceae archaeon]
MFERLPTVPLSQELIDRAFRRGSRAGMTPGNDEKVVLTAGNILSDNLANLVRKFPSLDNLPPFYRELADIIVGVDAMRISLSRLHWASKQVREISRESVGKMRRGQDRLVARRAAFGRMSSIIRSIDKDLIFLGEARDKLRMLPTIDPELPTILIAGYPNVGKSSFITQVTGAKPEIASYPFTTQGIFVGHFNIGEQRYQVVDTPGLLDRPLSEKNVIERQAIAVLRYLNGVVLYILDPSEHSGFPLGDQLKLLEDVKSWIKLPIIVVANKVDLLDYQGVPKMSTLTGEGVQEVLDLLVTALEAERQSRNSA